jgi:hypothetical protein
MRVVLTGVVVAFLCSAPAVAGQGRAADVVDALLEQVGGRAVWAAATGFHMVEVLEDGNLPLPAVREYWIDFRRARIMERTTTNSSVQLQALNESRGWMVRDGVRSEWTPEQVSGWRGFWPGIPTRVFHLLAARDPSIEVVLREGNRLDVEIDGRFVVWIALDDQGVPVAYGRDEAHTYTHFLGRMETYGPVRLWTAAYEPGDMWKVTMVDYDLFGGDLPVSFDPPTDADTHRPDPS